MPDLPILPVIGVTGSYQLLPPFDTKAINNEEYTCTAVRQLKDYLTNNEDPKKNIYDANGCDESDWEQDFKDNAYIVSLQSLSGHWLYVPVRYIQSYPNVNGVPYRTMMVGVSLPSLPVQQDLAMLMNQIQQLVTTTLGVTPVVKAVETSRPVLIDSAVHQQTQIERTLLTQGNTTYYAQLQQAQAWITELQAKVHALENYIENHSWENPA